MAVIESGLRNLGAASILCDRVELGLLGCLQNDRFVFLRLSVSVGHLCWQTDRFASNVVPIPGLYLLRSVTVLMLMMFMIVPVLMRLLVISLDTNRPLWLSTE